MIIKLATFLLLIVLFTSCSNQEQSNLPSFSQKIKKKDTITLEQDTFWLYDNNINFQVATNTVHFYKNGELYWVDTIDLALEKIEDIRLFNINNDSFYDIAIKTADLDVDLDYWYCYDTTSLTFKKVEGLAWIAAPSRLSQDKPYFFTRSPNGDSMWSSELFYVKGEQAIKIASLGYLLQEEAENLWQEYYSLHEYVKGDYVEVSISEKDKKKLLEEAYALHDFWLDYVAANAL